MEKPTLVDLRTGSKFNLGEFKVADIDIYRGSKILFDYGYELTITNELIRQLRNLYHSALENGIKINEERIERQKQRIIKRPDNKDDHKAEIKYLQQEIKKLREHQVPQKIEE